MDLTILRAEIDKIDEQIVDLLSQRAELALEIGRGKGAAAMAIEDRTREQEVLNKVCIRNRGPLSENEVLLIFKTIIKACRDLQFEV